MLPSSEYDDYTPDQLRLVCMKQERELEGLERENHILKKRMAVRGVLPRIDQDNCDVLIRSGGVHRDDVEGDAIESILPDPYPIEQSTVDDLRLQESDMVATRNQLLHTLQHDLTLSEQENTSVKHQLRETQCKLAHHSVVKNIIQALLQQRVHYEAKLFHQQQTHDKEVARQVEHMRSNIQRGIARELFQSGELRCVSQISLADGGESIYIDRETAKHMSEGCPQATSLKELRANQSITRLDFSKQTLTGTCSDDLLRAKEAYARQFDKILKMDVVKTRTVRHAGAMHPPQSSPQGDGALPTAPTAPPVAAVGGGGGTEGGGGGGGGAVEAPPSASPGAACSGQEGGGGAGEAGGAGDGGEFVWFAEVHDQCDSASLEKEVKRLIALSQEVTAVTENCAVLEFALEVVAMVQTGAVTDYHATSSRDLQQCRNELRKMRDLLRKKRTDQAHPAAGTAGASSAVISTDTASTAHGVSHVTSDIVERIKEMESVVDLCITQARLETAERVRGETRHYHSCREREVMIASYVTEISQLRKKMKKYELLELELSMYKKEARAKQCAFIASPAPQSHPPPGACPSVLDVSRPLGDLACMSPASQPSAVGEGSAGHAGRRNIQRPSSAPVKKTEFPVTETHWTSTGFAQPAIMKVCGGEHLQKVTRSEQAALVQRLYQAPLQKRLARAREERAEEKKMQQSHRTLLGPESVVEVNQRLYYAVREQDKQDARRLRREAEAERLRNEPPPLTKQSQGELIEKLYTKGLSHKVETKKKLFERLVVSQEHKSTKFTSMDEQNHVTNRLYAKKP